MQSKKCLTYLFTAKNTLLLLGFINLLIGTRFCKPSIKSVVLCAEQLPGKAFTFNL